MKRKTLLALAVALLCSVGSWAQKWTVGSEVAAGDYYIYNIGADNYLTRGNDWNMRCSVDEGGLVVTVTAGDNAGEYYLKTKYNYIGSDGYVDKATNNKDYCTWKVEAAEVAGYTNAYTLKSVSNENDKQSGHDQYLYWEGLNNNSHYMSCVMLENALGSGNATPNADYWLFIPKASRESIEGVSSVNPKDVTYLVDNPSFECAGRNGSDLTPGWTDGWAVNNQWTNNNYQGRFMESWQPSGNLPDAYTYQDVTVTSGHQYKLVAKCHGNVASDLAGVTLELGAEKVNITDWSNRDYEITTTASTGTLRIGYRRESCNTNWITWDMVRLYDVTPTVAERAVALPVGGGIEADTWYSYTVTTADGDYSFSATDGIIYTLDGSKLPDQVSSSLTSPLALQNGTVVYLKSSSARTLEVGRVTPVVENGDYYLYDATNKVFLSRGANYGARATVDKYGVPFTWNNYGKMIEFKDWPGVHLFFDQADHTNCWLYTDGASDKGNNRLFAFEETSGGYYLRDLAKAVYITHDGNVLTVPTTTSASATVWVALTKAERDAIVASYPADNKTNVITAAGLTSETDAEGFEAWLAANRAAKDKTSEVGTARFSGNAGDWTWASAAGSPSYGTDWTEAFQAAGTWSQTISGLAPGVYKVTVNAFERKSGFALCNSLGADGYEIVTAYFKANDEKLPLASWYSEKTGENNPNTTGEAATAFNNDKYKNTIYTYVADGGDGTGTLTLVIGKQDKASGSWVLFNNVTLTYYDTAVDDDDATAILDEAESTMASPMKASLYQALATAKTAFDEAPTVPNYNALRTAIDNTATSITSYANMKTNYLDKIAEVLATTNVYSHTSEIYTSYLAYKDAYDNYKEVGTADVENATANSLVYRKAGSGGYDRYTASTGTSLLVSGWTINGNDATETGSGFYINSWSTESAGEAPAADFANPFYEMWVGSGSLPATTLSTTIADLAPNAPYQVTANVRVEGSSKVAGSITMEVVGGAPVDVTAGDQIGETNRYIKSYTATGVTDGDGNLVLKFNITANSKVSWLSFRDLNYATSEAAISNDFTALNSAIKTAEDHTLGFEMGEYAPYNNVEAIETLSDVKAIDQDRYYISTVISAATTALTGAVWTANVAELNAFNDGDFSDCAEDTTSPLDYTPNGWTASGNMRVMIKNAEDYPGLADASASTALMSWSSGITYGETAGYEMPLKANSIYRLSFKAAGWNNETRSGMTVRVLNSTDGMAAMNLGTPDRDIKGNATNTAGMTTFEVLFATGAAGNYVFHVQSGNNFVITDLSLVKAASQTLSLPSAINYAAGTYPNVALNRTFASTDNWYTLCVPFAFDKNDFAAVKELDAITVNGENVAMSFADASTIVAGKPYLVKPKTANYDALSATDVAVVTSVEESSVTAGGYTVNYVGTYAGTTVNDETAGGNAFVVKNNGIYHVNSAVSVGAYRAYFTVEAETPVKALIFDFDELPTAVNAVEAAQNEKAEIYNLAGQRLNKAQKGVNIINGKKVLVK